MGSFKFILIILVWVVAFVNAQQAMMKPGKYRIENLSDTLVNILNFNSIQNHQKNIIILIHLIFVFFSMSQRKEAIPRSRK